jgi:hypothetical protein
MNLDLQKTGLVLEKGIETIVEFYNQYSEKR